MVQHHDTRRGSTITTDALPSSLLVTLSLELGPRLGQIVTRPSNAFRLEKIVRDGLAGLGILTDVRQRVGGGAGGFNGGVGGWVGGVGRWVHDMWGVGRVAGWGGPLKGGWVAVPPFTYMSVKYR